MHSSHPVHSASITACMRFAPPAIASTGHACRHSVQPMHHVSSMRATCSGPGVPRLASGATDGATDDRGDPREAALAARRTTVEGFAFRHGLRVGRATVVAAAPALGLRQHGIDAPGERAKIGIGKDFEHDPHFTG